jgi:hypothetical protein
LTPARQQELEEVAQRSEQVAREMLHQVLQRRVPDPEQLQAWVQALSCGGISLFAGAIDTDTRPLVIEGKLTLTRASVETSCCVHHAVNPLVMQTFDGLFASMEKALWKLPSGRFPHTRRPPH